MADSSVVHTEWSGMGLETSSSGSLDQPQPIVFPRWSFRWGVFSNSGSDVEVPVAFGQWDLSALARWVVEVQKLKRQNQERLAVVYLDPTAQQLIDALDHETSIRWEDLPSMVEGKPHDILRSVVLLAGANLCEASPTRLRLSEYGDKLLATGAEQANSEVERQPVR